MINEFDLIEITNLKRLKMELNNKEYYTDEEYRIFLQENDLLGDDDYGNTKEDKIKLLKTTVQVLETLANDVDLMRKLDAKDILTTSEASKYLQKRIDQLNSKIVDLEFELLNGSNVSPLFFGGRR